MSSLHPSGKFLHVLMVGDACPVASSLSVLKFLVVQPQVLTYTDSLHPREAELGHCLEPPALGMREKQSPLWRKRAERAN